VTYDQTKKWLDAIGGEQIVARETDKFGSVIVRVKSSKSGDVSRHALFDETLTGYEREKAIREALVRACEELRLALG
jgi:hypothetical protein